jgi:hypothetical protein
VVTVCIGYLNCRSVFYLHDVAVCYNFNKKIANVSINSIIKFVFVMEKNCVFCEVGTESTCYARDFNLVEIKPLALKVTAVSDSQSLHPY